MGSHRCDDIVRLIDEALGDAPAPAERPAEAGRTDHRPRAGWSTDYRRH